MSRGKRTFEYNGFWLEYRRDGKAPGIWQIAAYKQASRSVVYRSTRTDSLEDAKAALISHANLEKAKQRQRAEDAEVIPLIMTYWQEHAKSLIAADQSARSFRAFMSFLNMDEAGPRAVVTDMNPALFERFRRWRMGPHKFSMPWGTKEYSVDSQGVSGDTVERNINDVRAAINHAELNMRIALAPRIKGVDAKHKNPLRERVLTEDELARIFWYARHFPMLFRFIALQMATSVRPDAAKKFDARQQFDGRFIDLQPDAAPRTKKRNAIIPAIRPMRPILRAWAKEDYAPVTSHKTAWRTLRRVLGLSDDVFPKTIRHTVATWLYNDPAIPERQISEMLGHEGSLRRTSRLYAKYRPDYLGEVEAGLERIWLRTTMQAKRYGAGHCLATDKYGALKVVAADSEFSYDLRRVETGAGEGIRTLDPNLGKVVLYP
ncbi:hypothetical protein GCM10007897_39540 [Sphingobium jiangsuense]|nr:hypothetical protein GCM10007897_39540 [Sphingobium jiangsuense]